VNSAHKFPAVWTCSRKVSTHYSAKIRMVPIFDKYL